MSQEVYFGEVDIKRFDRFEDLLERIASKLEKPAKPSTNNGIKDKSQICPECNRPFVDHFFDSEHKVFTCTGGGQTS